MVAANIFGRPASVINVMFHRSAILTLVAGLLVLSAACIWSEFVQSPDRIIFFHLARPDRPVIFGIERDELLKFSGKGSGRIRTALAQHRRLAVQQFGVSKMNDGRVRIGREKQIELTPADASAVRFGATFVVP